MLNLLIDSNIGFYQVDKKYLQQEEKLLDRKLFGISSIYSYTQKLIILFVAVLLIIAFPYAIPISSVTI